MPVLTMLRLPEVVVMSVAGTSGSGAIEVVEIRITSEETVTVTATENETAIDVRQ